MSTSGLSAEEALQFNAIVGDLNEIFDRGRIEIDEIENIGLESEIVAEYLEGLRFGSGPESAPKDKLVTSASVFARVLIGRMSPEIRIESGIVDYRLQTNLLGRNRRTEMKSRPFNQLSKVSPLG